MNSFTVQDVLNRVGDWLSNYNVGTVTTDSKIRAVDHAVNYLKRMLGFPQDEVKTTFYYLSNNFFYALPTDFQDPIGLFYDSNFKNIPRYGPKWEYRPYQELMGRTGNYPATTNQWSITTVNGSNQVMLLGTNVNPGGTLDTLSAVNSWTATGGASALAQDVNNFPSNFGLTGSSLKFTAASHASHATSGIQNLTVNYSINNLISDDGHVEFYTMMSSNLVTSITLVLTTSTGNNFSFTETADYNGNAFETSTWQKISFAGTDAVITGSPSSLNIKNVSITYNLASGYTGGTFWVNDLYYVFPDLMDLYYYSTKKGTDINGATIYQYTAVTDNIPYDFDFIEPIALRAAYYLNPSLRQDPAWAQMYSSEFTNFVKLYSRSHKKIRTRNDATRHRLSR